jgi:PKD repeat protein
VYFFPGFGNPNDSSWATGTYEINQYKSVRDFYLGDFYPLTPYDTNNTVWLAYEFNRPDLNGGVVHAFRRDASPTPSLVVQLLGLDPLQTYDVQDFDRGDLGWYAGSNLMSAGLTIQLNQRQAAVLSYTKAEGVQLSATATPQAGLAPMSVEFTAAATAASGNPVTYAWTFGDGGTSTSQNPTHLYGAPGRFTAQVTATDGLGATNTTRISVLASRPQNSMRITFAGYAPTEPLTNFPMLFVFGTNLSANGFSYNQVKSPNGWDLVFMDSSQTRLLNYEIEKWDTNGNSYVWIQVPVLTSNAFIQAYWGDTNLISAPLPAATNGLVWANGYAGVWHLGEEDGTPYDSTPNRVAGTVSTTLGPCTQGAGAIIGSGCAFGGGYLAASAADFPAGASPRTVSTWFIKTSASTAAPGEEIVGYGDNLTPGDRFGLWITGNGTATALGVEDQGVARSFAWTWDPRWHFLAAVLPTGQTNLSGLDLYYDGKLNSSASGSGVINTLPDELCLAGVPGYHTSDVSYNFPGVLDEVRISSVARSANWLWAEYQNVVSNAVFNSYGPVTLYSPHIFPARLTVRIAGGNAVITWPANVAMGTVLQESPDLVHWTNSTASVVLNGTNNTVDLSPQLSKGFYRLAY